MCPGTSTFCLLLLYADMIRTVNTSTLKSQHAFVKVPLSRWKYWLHEGMVEAVTISGRVPDRQKLPWYELHVSRFCELWSWYEVQSDSCCRNLMIQGHSVSTLYTTVLLIEHTLKAHFESQSELKLNLNLNLNLYLKFRLNLQSELRVVSWLKASIEIQFGVSCD